MKKGGAKRKVAPVAIVASLPAPASEQPSAKKAKQAAAAEARAEKAAAAKAKADEAAAVAAAKAADALERAAADAAQEAADRAIVDAADAAARVAGAIAGAVDLTVATFSPELLALLAQQPSLVHSSDLAAGLGRRAGVDVIGVEQLHGLQVGRRLLSDLTGGSLHDAIWALYDEAAVLDPRLPPSATADSDRIVLSFRRLFEAYAAPVATPSSVGANPAASSATGVLVTCDEEKVGMGLERVKALTAKAVLQAPGIHLDFTMIAHQLRLNRMEKDIKVGHFPSGETGSTSLAKLKAMRRPLGGWSCDAEKIFKDAMFTTDHSTGRMVQTSGDFIADESVLGCKDKLHNRLGLLLNSVALIAVEKVPDASMYTGSSDGGGFESDLRKYWCGFRVVSYVLGRVGVFARLPAVGPAAFCSALEDYLAGVCEVVAGPMSYTVTAALLAGLKVFQSRMNCSIDAATIVASGSLGGSARGNAGDGALKAEADRLRAQVQRLEAAARGAGDASGKSPSGVIRRKGGVDSHPVQCTDPKCGLSSLCKFSHTAKRARAKASKGR